MYEETGKRIAYWEQEIVRLKGLIDECEQNGEDSEDYQLELYEAECNLHYAWQDDELEEMRLRVVSESRTKT